MPLSPDPMAEASRKRRRRTALASAASYADLISNLPDDALLSIMSHLDARQAVQTCVLSKRWGDLWRSLRCINVSVDEFDHMVDTYVESEVLFKKFVNRFLLVRNPTSLDEFRLRYSLMDGDTQMDLDALSADANQWIRHALEHKARAVEVVNQGYPLQLVPAVFTSMYLRRLYLSSATLIAGFFGQLQTGCPALEDLFLLDCVIMDIEISSQTLKVLTLDTEVRFSPDYRASISAPSLISLSFGAPEGGRLPLLKNMESLETAWISISTDIEVILSDDIRQFLRGLSCVRSLDFYYRGSELKMEKYYQWCPKFSNLINLTLNEWCVHTDFYALIVFLQNSPSLKKLTLELGQSSDTSSKFIGELEERSFKCEQLEIIEILCSEGNPRLSAVKQFFLDSGIASGQIQINHWN